VTASYLGLAVLDAFLLVAGFGALYGIGLVRGTRDALRHLGLALLVGWALAGIAESFALVLGAPLDRWVVASLALAIGAAGALLGRRVAAYRLGRVDEPGPASWLAVAGAAVVVVQLAGLLRRALGDAAPLQFDAWGFWLAKARTIADFGGLDTAAGGFTSFANPGYPPFVPAVDASAFAFMGNTNAAPLSLQHWVMFAAFLGALASLLSVRVRPAILWPCLALLAVLPTLTSLIGSSLGDEPLILLLGVGGASAALWLLERDARFAALAGIFFAAAALAKNEGMPIALVMALVMLGAALARPPRRLVAPALVFLAPILALAPWKVWLRVKDVQVSPDYRVTDVLHPGLLADRFDRLSYGAHKLPAYMFSPGRWLLAVPLMLVAVVLVARARPALAVLALAPVVAIPLGLLVIWWIGYPPVDFYVATTADRVPAPAVVLAAIFLPLLLAEASRRDEPSL
jgi:hypothetical protein